MVEAGLITQLADLGWKVKFDGHHQFEDISTASDPPIGRVKNPRLVSRVTEAVSLAVGKHIHNGELPVTLGGDHSLVRDSVFSDRSRIDFRYQALGTISGTLR
jgi:arginase